MESSSQFRGDWRFIFSIRANNAFRCLITDVFAADYGADSHYCGGVPQKRGSLGELPTITNVDLSAQYNLEFGGSDVLLTLDIFNLFDSDKRTRISETAETFSGGADPDYLKTVATTHSAVQTEPGLRRRHHLIEGF